MLCIVRTQSYGLQCNWLPSLSKRNRTIVPPIQRPAKSYVLLNVAVITWDPFLKTKYPDSRMEKMIDQ